MASGTFGLSYVSSKAELTSLGARLAGLAACVLIVLAAAGCGESEGVAEGTAVTAYVEASLCGEAKRELAEQDGRAGDIRVRAVCLPSPDKVGKLDLATVGANARQATQDSTTVGYLEADDSRASRFTHPILESASVAWVSSSSGKAAMAQLLRAVEAADAGSLRESVQAARHEP